MRIITKGATSKSIYVVILDSTSTTGGRKTGLVFNTSSLTAYYALNGAASVAITLATLAAASSAWSSGGFKEVDATNMPGLYRLDVPNAALTGADSVVITLKGATGMVQVDEEIQLTGVDVMDAVRGGMTALPNANAEAAGGLYTRGTGAGQINQAANGQVDANVKTWIGGTIPAVNVTGVPLIDLKYTLGTISPAAAGSVRADAVTGAVGSVTAAVSTNANATETAIKAVTDLLPNAGALSSLAQDSTVAKAAALATAQTAITAIKAVTDLLPNAGALSSLAQDSTVAKAATVATAANLATAQTGITGIKAVTDLIPNAGAMTNLDAAVSSRLASASITLTGGAVSVDTGSKTGLRLSSTGVGDILTTALTESYSADGAAPTLSQAIFAIQQMMQEKNLSSTTMTVKKLDGSTTAMTFTLDSATTPASITRTT